MVESLNYAYEHGQRLGIISLIPKKDKNLQYLLHYHYPLSLLNNDYKIATKVIARPGESSSEKNCCW